MAVYQGEFRAGKKHGKGLKRWPWGDQYEGQFVNDQKEGHGIYSWGRDGPWAGEVYSGAFMADKRSGMGTYSWSTGEAYSGPWIEDLMIGPILSNIADRVMAHARADAESIVAVGRVGVRVCRKNQVGIGVDNWISGHVIEVLNSAIAIRIEDPGQIELHLNGVQIVRGALVWDAAPNWTLC